MEGYSSGGNDPNTLLTDLSTFREKRPAGKVINGCNAKIIEKCLRSLRERVIDEHIEKMANR